MNIIQAFIKVHNLSNRITALLIGSSESAVSQWRSGRRRIPRYIHNHVDDLFGVSESHLNRILKKRMSEHEQH